MSSLLRQAIFCFVWLPLLLFLETSGFLLAQDGTDSSGIRDEDGTVEAAKLFQYFGCLAKNLDVRLASGEPLRLDEKPLQKWTIGSEWHGSHYIWTCKNRPVLIGCFLVDSMRADRRQVYLELHSLVDERFTPMEFPALKNFQWDPLPKKTSTLLIEGLAQANQNERLRRIQMRQIAETFSVTMYEDPKYGSDRTEQLRMLATPVYRYPDGGDGGLQGAIYAFVKTNGTDPDFLLAIENDPKLKENGWRVRPIRYTSRRLELHRLKSVVWEVPEFDMGSSPVKLTDPYMIITLLETETSVFNAVREQMIQSGTKKD